MGFAGGHEGSQYQGVLLPTGEERNGSCMVGSGACGFGEGRCVGSRRRRRSGKTRYNCIRPVQRYTSAIVRRCQTGVSSSPGLMISASAGCARLKSRSSSSVAFAMARWARAMSECEVKQRERIRLRSRRISLPTSWTVCWVSRAMPVHGWGTRCRTSDSPVAAAAEPGNTAESSATKDRSISQ